MSSFRLPDIVPGNFSNVHAATGVKALHLNLVKVHLVQRVGVRDSGMI